MTSESKDQKAKKKRKSRKLEPCGIKKKRAEKILLRVVSRTRGKSADFDIQEVRSAS